MLKQKIIAALLLGTLAGCATTPIGPHVTVMPAPGKPFELFVQEDRTCRQYAEQSVGINPNDVAAQNFAGSAAVGTVVGAAIGALAGGHRGAGTGAAVGLLAGSAAGSSQSAYSARDAQRLYDMAYQQCMYAKGNQLPGYPIQRLPPAPKMDTPYPPPPAPNQAPPR